MFNAVRALLTGAGVATLVLAGPALAQTQFSASGDFGTVDPIFQNFRNALGAGSQGITWDGVPDARSAPNPMPGDQFNNRGVLFSTPGDSLQVSANAGNPGGVPTEFGNLQPGYSQIFQPFSGDQLFTAIGSNIVDVQFVLANTSTQALTNGFGVVFSDVDLFGPTTIELFNINGGSLGTFTVPASQAPLPENESFSFLGLLYDAPTIARARITSGNFEVGPGFSDMKDLVVMDDYVFGATVIPEPSTWLALLAGLGGLAWLRRRSFV
jgi:hypothetical protein